MTAFSNRITAIWGVLVISTALSFMLGHTAGIGGSGSVVILAVACVKVRFIVMDFMEVGTAPRALQIAANLWIVAVATLLITLYLLGSLPGTSAAWAGLL